MKKYKVLFTESYLTEEGEKYLEENSCQVITKFFKYETNEEKLIAALDDCDAVIAGGERYSARVIDSSKRLKIIARLGMGTDTVDVTAAIKRGIIVTNTPGATSRAVAEMTIALIFCLLRRIPWFNNNLKQGIWNQEPTVTELSSNIVGIIGMGNIGKEVIKLLKPFEPKVIAYDVVLDTNFAKEYGVEFVQIERLMEKSSIVSIHLPLNEKTKGMINANLLKRMKPTAYLINTSRGAIVDKDALRYVLEKKLISGAGIDTHWETPCVPDDPIVKMENVIATPHIGYNTKESKARMVKIAAEEVVDVLNGRQPKYPVSI